MTAPSIRTLVLDYFNARGWGVTEINANTISTAVAGQNGTWTAYANAREQEAQLLVHSVMDQRVPAKRRKEVALFLTRANFGLLIGNFELDLDDGELRYKTSIDVEDAELTDALIDHLVLANVTTMDRYLPGIEAVVAGAKADDAIADVER
jgi:hypothetical protein